MRNAECTYTINRISTTEFDFIFEVRKPFPPALRKHPMRARRMRAKRDLTAGAQGAVGLSVSVVECICADRIRSEFDETYLTVLRSSSNMHQWCRGIVIALLIVGTASQGIYAQNEFLFNKCFF